jgi:hypothetical protein
VTYLNNLNPLSIGFNSNGVFKFQLPQGPACDSYKLSLFVNIIDNENGVTIFNLPIAVKVLSNSNVLNDLVKNVLIKNTSSDFVNTIFNGNLQSSSQAISNLISTLNTQYESNTNSDVISFFLS